ncbi:hypothetical protein MJO29_010288, partial [Puccinia striiformis f. sp. tritici]
TLLISIAILYLHPPEYYLWFGLEDPNVEKDIVRFWKDLPNATLLGHQFLVRPIYKELCKHFEAKGYNPGIGKTVFSTYYMWIAACKKKTVVWKPLELGWELTYLMTPGGVELVANSSCILIHALRNPKTVYIVDGQVPNTCKASTLLFTSPQCEHYKHLQKQPDTKLLYMKPCSYEELQHCKAIIYPNEGILPTTLMDCLFDWYGSVPQYVLNFAATDFKTSCNESTVFDDLIEELTQAINQGQVSHIINVHQARNREGEYPHHVLHIHRLPNGNLAYFHLAWESCQVDSAVVNTSLEICTEVKHSFQIANENTYGNLQGLMFEPYAHAVLQAGGTFQACHPSKGARPSNQNGVVEFTNTKPRLFRTYNEKYVYNNVNTFNKYLGSAAKVEQWALMIPV